MNILVTGALGQLGNELKWCFDNKRSRIGITDIFNQENVVTYVDIDTLDISNYDAVVAFVKNGAFDAIINCAAFTNVDKCEEVYDLAYNANALGPKNLAIACDMVGAKLVHISTDYVFSGDGSKPYTELDTVEPSSVYGKTKAMGE
ncbi:MAG: NAD(P)-dependent oxidoreductase, partial [Clostridia bacterium]|nr:NAD(P)-dependent oxidoreductase [Clostridia bacterium]